VSYDLRDNAYTSAHKASEMGPKDGPEQAEADMKKVVRLERFSRSLVGKNINEALCGPVQRKIDPPDPEHSQKSRA
jgi:hypothetical protein